MITIMILRYIPPHPLFLYHLIRFTSQNSFRALYRTFTQCCFIEDDGDIVFYKNKDGKAQRVLAEGALDREVKKPA
jgi:omega-6 fatty acid desaturase (delta-12 desaturase)